MSETNAPENEKRDKHLWLSRLATTMETGVLVLSPSLELDLATGNALQQLGCSDEEQLLREWESYRNQLELPAADCSVRGDGECATSTIDRTFHIDADDAHRHGPLEFQIHDISSEDCSGYLVLVRSRWSVAAQRTARILAETQRNFQPVLRAAAHEMRTPLQAIAVAANTISESLDDASDGRLRERQHGVLKSISDEVQRLSRMVDCLTREGTWIDSTESRFDLGELVLDTVELLEPVASRQGVELIAELPDASIELYGPRGQLKQAVINIVVNALEALQEAGSDAPAITLRVHRTPTGTELSIEDNGPGMPAHALARAFDPYFTTREGGTGLGLYLTKMYVKRFGGHVELESCPGRGTAIRVRLPLLA